MAISIVQHIRRMRGGAQSHLMRAADGHFYVVKFQNNPQHLRVLANEWLGGKLAERLGLPAAPCEIVEVGDWLIRKTPDLHMQLAGKQVACRSGLHFGSRFVVSPMEGQVLDYLPESLLADARVRNLEAFAGALAFDKWLCNADGRQVVYWRRGRERKYAIAMVDQGHCFNDGEWVFPDSPLRGIFGSNQVYGRIVNWESFQPWLSRIENFPVDEMWKLSETVPPEWYDAAWDAMHALVSKLIQRQSRVRELIEGFRTSSRAPFPRWSESALPQVHAAQTTH